MGTGAGGTLDLELRAPARTPGSAEKTFTYEKFVIFVGGHYRKAGIVGLQIVHGAAGSIGATTSV